MSPEIIVYIKEDCPLCDAMLTDLRAALTALPCIEPSRVILRDIERNDEWYRVYREYVPVIVVDGEEVCHYFFDQQEFEQAVT